MREPTAKYTKDGDVRNTHLLLCISWFILALCVGCNFAPKYSKPSVATPAQFKELTPEQRKETDGWKQAQPKDDSVRTNWVEMFDDPLLNQLEQQAARSNLTVSAAFANFLSARALVKQARSQYFPLVTATPSVTRSRQSSLRTQPNSSGGSFSFTEYSLPLDASWEADLWGRIRNNVQASAIEAQATFADLENMRLSVQTELAADYFQLRALDAQKQLLTEAVRAYQESLDLAQVRRDTGIASDQDVAQAETQLNTTKAQATDVGIQRAQMEHAIALLIAEPASTFSISVEAPKATPPAVPFGLPSELLERRPDIAAAERRVAEANSQIGVARAAYFPTLTLNGSAGVASSAIENLATWPSFVWSLGASLAQTLFDGGKRNAATEQARATYERTVANYRQTVLTAFREVEDNLSTLRILSQELQQQEAAVQSSQRYLILATDRYKLGIDSYLNVITAQTTLLSNQRTAVNLRLQQMTATVQLIKSLGGGWEAEQLRAVSVISKQ